MNRTRASAAAPNVARVAPAAAALNVARAAAAAVVLLAPSGSTASPAERVRVYAAASLTDAFTEIARSFERSHPGVEVDLSFGGSQALRIQIEHGAPADLFASADPAQTDSLERQGLARTAAAFAHNRLVVAIPAERARVKTLSDLAHPGLRIVLAERTVPAGRYAEEALARMERARGAGFVRSVTANVMSRETNVRAALAKVVLGEADAAIVYATDAASAAGKVAALEIPEAAEIQAEYRIALTERAAGSPQALAFRDAVLGDAGRAVLWRHGFER